MVCSGDFMVKCYLKSRKEKKEALLELSASSADDAPASQCLMGLMSVDNMFPRSEKQNHECMK